MQPVARRLGKTVVVAGLMAVPIAAHVAVVTHRGLSLAGPLMAMQAGLVAWFSLSLAAPRAGAGVRAMAAAMVFLSSLWLVLHAGSGLMLAAAVPHAIAYVGLLTVFAASLAPGQTPVITVIARRARGSLDDTLIAYTRRVTIAWCVFFGVQLAASLLLYLFAPLVWWSTFVNLCTLPLVATMFAAELCWRHLRHGIHAPAGAGGRMGKAFRVVGQMRAPGLSPTAQSPVHPAKS